MREVKHRSLMSWIYIALLSFPMVAVLSRVIYVQSNKNAYQSYYGETINKENDILIDNITDFELNETYFFNSNTFNIKETTSPVGAYNKVLNISNFQLISSSANIVKNVIAIGLYIDNNNRLSFSLKYDDNSSEIIYANSYYLLAKFSYVSDNLNYNFAYNDIFYKVEYNSYSYLDNAFEYSLSTFVQENSFGRINFFSWFTNMFIDDNAHNNLYVGYVNWYLNYTMLVSCGYLLFLILMWFINFSRKLLERGMNYDW